MGLKITHDGLSPKISSVKNKLTKLPKKELSKLLKYGMVRAKRYAKGGKTGKLERGIFYRVYKSGKGALYSVTNNSETGFPYNLWVNQDLVLENPSRKFFKNGQNILYGQTGLKSPKGNPIQWRVKPRFFHRAEIDMRKKFKSLSKRLQKEIYS